VVHRLDHQGIALCPVVAPAGDQPDADRIAPCHKPVVVVLDLVNPVRAGRGLLAGDGRQGSMNLVSAASRLRTRSINMPLIRLKGDVRFPYAERPRNHSDRASRVSVVPRGADRPSRIQ
jgi:hypothetical protein